MIQSLLPSCRRATINMDMMFLPSQEACHGPWIPWSPKCNNNKQPNTPGNAFIDFDSHHGSIAKWYPVALQDSPQITVILSIRWMTIITAAIPEKVVLALPPKFDSINFAPVEQGHRCHQQGGLSGKPRAPSMVSISNTQDPPTKPVSCSPWVHHF